jgi:DNA polymerase type B, organellar and viral
MYKYNLTDRTTLPGIAYDIWAINYYDQEIGLKLLKGPIEKEIRSGYFGGNVNVYKHKGLKLYIYDINSQYPYALCQAMPIGNPVFSTNSNLWDYFGFIYAEVIPPLNMPDQWYVLLGRDSNGNRMNFRKPYKGMFFSEELKQAISEFSYSANILWGYHWPKKSSDPKLFINFVTEFYDAKKTASDPIQRNISKLILNSSIGKFGEKENLNRIEIVNKEEGDKILRKYHYNKVLFANEEIMILKYGARLHDRLLKIIREEEEDIYISEGFKPRKGGANLKNISIAAAVSAYGRMHLNKFRKLYPILYTDTDSFVTTQPIDPKYIGPELGQMKLVAEIEEGYFIREKLYAYKTKEGIEKIVAAGVKDSILTLDDFRKLAEGEDVVINQDRLFSN